MTKRDLVVKIAAETNLIQADVAEVVQKTLDYIAEELVAGRDIELRNLVFLKSKYAKAAWAATPTNLLCLLLFLKEQLSNSVLEKS